MQFLNHAVKGGGDFHGGFVGLHLADLVELLHARARLHEPLDELAFGYAFAYVG